MATKGTSANIFAAAAKTATTKGKPKNTRPVIRIVGEDFDKELVKFAKLSAQMAELKSDLAIVQENVKNMSIDEFCKLYGKTKTNPGSCDIVSDSDAEFMLVPTDKYITLTEESAEELNKKYKNKGIVTEEVTYSFNPALLDKYAKVLSDLIMKSAKIDADDKALLIVATKTLSVTKGTIERGTELSKDVRAFVNDVQPIFQMKNPKLKEEE